MDISIVTNALSKLKAAEKERKKILINKEEECENKNHNMSQNLQEMLEDSCIKRFEYTLAIAMKIMRKLLKDEYFKDESDLTVNNVFRLMESYGFISDWQKWREYYQIRNNTAHEYSFEKSRELLKITNTFIEECDFLVAKLSAYFSQENFFKQLAVILEKYKRENELQFFAYGSRVKGKFQSSSDLDILIKGRCAIGADVLNEITAAVDSSELPFVVHFSDYYDMDPDFYESIKNDLKAI